MVIKSGVPQGSILGPIHFLLYINDIENCSKLISYMLFADDTNIFYSNKCLKILSNIIQTEIDKVAEWLNVNKLSLNTTKTKVILFRSPNKKPSQIIKININGIIIDKCLTWKDHIAKVTKKIVRASGIIDKMRHFVNRNSLKLIYYALVYPYSIFMAT
jgi:DNA-directed RNA polymerase beta' subunit